MQVISGILPPAAWSFSAACSLHTIETPLPISTIR
jgi:hypothetical protein